MNTNTFGEQVRRNAVALISLVIAVTSLLYNTWRNEHSEWNRNQRQASFELLLTLGEFKEIVFLSYYDAQHGDDSQYRRAWAKVLTIRDLATVLESPVPDSANVLHLTWGSSWEALDDRGADGEPTDGARLAKQVVDEAIEGLRLDVLARLRELT